MSYWALAALINAISTSGMGILVYLKNRKDISSRLWARVSLIIAFWSYSYFFWQISTEKSHALFWCRVLMAWAIFIPAANLHFLFAWLDIYKQKKKLLFFCYALSFMAFLLNFTPFFVRDVEPILFFKYWPKAGVAYLPFLIFWIWMAIYAIYISGRMMGLSTGIKRNQIKFVLIGFILGYGGGVTNYPLWFDIKIPPVGNILISVYCIIVFSYAIVKYRFLDVEIAITKAGIFLVVYSFILGIPFWIGLKLLGTGLWIVPVAIMCILATTGPFVYRRLQKKVSDVLLSQQRRYHEFLLQAARGMTRERNLSRLLKVIVYAVRRIVRTEFAVIFLEDKKKGHYSLKAERGRHGFSKDFVFSYEHPIMKSLRTKKTSLNYKEIGDFSREGLYEFGDLIVPSFMNEELLGVLILGRKQDGTSYNKDDINVFEILSRQVAMAIKHCTSFEELKEQERFLTAEKLAMIDGMADGVAHQMRNRLTAFSAIAAEQEIEVEVFLKKYPQLIEQNPELKKTLGVVLKSAKEVQGNVQRTAKIIKGILDFANTQHRETSFSDFSLKEIIDLSLVPLRAKHSITEEDLPLQLEVKQEDLIYGIKGQIAEIVYNLLDNSYEALKEKIKYRLSEKEKKSFKPFIKVKLQEKKDAVIIEISDNGVGVKREDKAKIFSPYFTTKSSTISGIGIGMFVIKKTVEENHKGKIWFESSYMKGSKFFIELPKKKSI